MTYKRKDTDKTRSLTLRLSLDTIEALRREAQKQDRSINYVAKKILEQATQT